MRRGAHNHHVLSKKRLPITYRCAMFFAALSSVSSSSGNLQQNRATMGTVPPLTAHTSARCSVLSSALPLESNYSRWRKSGRKFGVTKCMRGRGGGVRCEFRSFFANLSCMFLADGRHVSRESVGSCVCVQSLNKLISNIRVSFFSLPSPPLCFSLLYVYKADWKVELPPTGSDISFFFFCSTVCTQRLFLTWAF